MTDLIVKCLMVSSALINSCSIIKGDFLCAETETENYLYRENCITI